MKATEQKVTSKQKENRQVFVIRAIAVNAAISTWFVNPSRSGVLLESCQLIADWPPVAAKKIHLIGKFLDIVE